MIKLIGIPFDGNSSFLKGPALAPQRVRLMHTDGSANSFCENGKEISPGKAYIDCGDLAFENTASAAAYQHIKQQILEEIKEGNKQFALVEITPFLSRLLKLMPIILATCTCCTWMPMQICTTILTTTPFPTLRRLPG